MQISILVAFGYGLLSFLSACILPLIPVYLSSLVGPDIFEDKAKRKSLPIFRHSLSFVLGFSVVFTLFGAGSGLLGAVLLSHLTTVRQIAGVVLIVLGLVMLAALKIPWLNFEKRLTVSLPTGGGYLRSFLAGELKSNADIGTNYNNLIAAAQARGIHVESRQNMTLNELKSALRSKKPVMLAFQAWGDDTTDYANDWNDGRWAIAVGYDDKRIYFMDPSTLGNFTYIAIPEFLTRWHDTDSDNTTQLIHFGLIFSKDDKPSYDPNAILPLSFVPKWFGIGLGNACG